MSCLLPYISNSPYSQTTKDKMQSLHTDIFVKLKETKGVYQHKSGFLYLPVGTTERTQLERKQVTTSLGLINKDRKLVSIVKREVGNKVFEVLKVDVSGVGLEYDAQERQQYEISNNLTDQFFQLERKDTKGKISKVVRTIANIKEFDSTLDNNLIEILNHYGFNVKESTTKEIQTKYGITALGVTDLLNKLITVSDNRNLDTLPEEFGHAIMMLLGKTKEVSNLMYQITNWEEYKKIEQEYSDIYSGSKERIKFEACGKLIAKHILNQSGLGDSKLKKILTEILDYIKKLFGKNYEYDLIASKLVSDVLKRDSGLINTNIPESFVAVNMEQALSRNPQASRVHNFMKNLPVNLTGSLAVSEQGLIFRDKDEEIHDLDYTANSEERIDVIGKMLEAKFGAIPTHWGIVTKHNYCKTWTVPAEGYEFAYISRYESGWKEGTLRTNTVLKNTKTGKYYYIHPEISITVDLFKNTKEGINGLVKAPEIFIGKQNIKHHSEIFFGREKDQKDYVLYQTNTEEISDPKFLFYQLQSDITAPQFNETTKQQLLDFLKQVNPNFKVEVLGNLGVNGLLDLKNALIQLQTGQESALSEEVSHVFVEMLDPKLKSGLQKLIKGSKIYSETYEAYKDIYKKNGKPDLDRIEREASAKLLAQAVYAQSTGDYSKFNEWSSTQLTGLKLWINDFINWILGLDMNSFLKFADQLLKGDTTSLTSTEIDEVDNIWYQMTSDQVNQASGHLLNYDNLTQRIDEAAEFINNTLNDLLKNKSLTDLNKIFQTEEGKFLPKKLIQTTKKFSHDLNMQVQSAKNFIVTIDQMKSFFETIENEVLSDIENRPSDKVKLDEAATVYSIIKQWKAYVSELHMDLASEKGDLKDLIDGLNTSLHSSEARLLNIFQDEVFHYFSEDIDKANKETERIYNEKLEAIDKSGLPQVTKDKLSEETKLERDKFLWDKRKLTHLLLGHKDDVSSLSLMLVNASNTDDPIIALFRKNLDRLMFKNRDENISRIEKFRSEVKLPDMSREELGSKFTKEETEYVYDYEKGVWEEKTNRFFLNEVNNKAYVDAKKLKEDYDSAKRAYHEKTIPYKEFLAKKKAYMTFMFKNWNQPLVKEFYEKNFLYNPDLVSLDKQEALEYLQNKIEDIWERMDMLDLEIEKQGGIPTKDQEKSRKDILIEYKFLSNPRDVTGLEKVGIDKEAYEIMKDKMSWKKEQDFYDYELNQDQFTREFKYHASLLDKTSFEEDIFNQIDTHINAGEYDKVRSILDAELSISDANIILPALTAINKWFTDHTAIKLDPAFYEERKLITERLEQVEDEISKIIGTEKVSYKDTWDRVFELTSPYRDRNGVINATLIPDEVKQILYDLEDELSKKRRETSNDRAAYLKNNFFEQSELDKLYGNKKAGIEGLFNEQKKLLAQIDEYQTRDYNEYWEDVSSNLPISDVSAFKNATSIFYGEDAKPRYIWSKQIIKKTQYEKLLPTSEFYKRKIKDEYKTQKITFKQSDELASQGIFQQNGKPIIPTVNEFGDWIPITMTNQGKVVGNPEYINNEFFALKTDKELFSIMERLKQEYIDAQLKLDRRERQNFRVPQKLRDLFEDFSLKEKWDNFGQSFKQGGEGNMLTVLKDWSIFDEVGSMKVNVPVRYSERVEKPTKDVLESVFAYVEGVELAEKLKDQLPIVQAIDSVMSINPQSNKNRLEKFRGIVDRDFKGQKKAYELGPNKTWGKRIDYVVRSVMKLTAIRSLSIFNPFNNVKNFLAAKATTRINFNVSAKLIDPALLQADLWVSKNLPKLIMEGQSDHPSSFEYKLIEYFSPELSGKFKEYLPGQMKEVIKKGSFLMSGMEFGEYMNTCTTIVAYLKAIPYDGGTLFDALALQGGKITSPINLEDHRLVIREFLRTWQGNVGSQREAVEADKYTLASMALFFKRYLIPTALNNFGSQRYNFVRNDVTQGYWRTVYTFMLRNVHTGFKHLKDNWNVLSNEEKINMFKAIRQAIILLTFTMVMMYILGFKGSDPDRFKKLKKNRHIHNQMIYLTLMIENETSALSPLRLGNVTNEIYRNVKSPFLMLKPYEDIVNVLDSGTDAIMGSPDARYKRSTGKVKKGDLKVWNHLLTLTPFQKTRDVYDRDVLIEDIKITQQMMTRR